METRVSLHNTASTLFINQTAILYNDNIPLPANYKNSKNSPEGNEIPPREQFI